MQLLSKKSCITGSVLCAGLLLGGSFLPAWQDAPAKPGSRTNRNQVDTELDDHPERGNGWVTLHKCRVKLIDSVTLATDRPGLIASVEPEEGGAVDAGQEIIRLKDEGAQAVSAIAKAKAKSDVNVRFAKASADVAEAEWKKMVDANRRIKGSVPEIEVERANLNWVKGLLQKEHAEHERAIAALEAEKADEDLKSMRVLAPFAGTVRRIHKRPGEAVTQGTPILELVSTEWVKIEGLLPIEDFWDVEAGDTVEVKVELKVSGRKLEIEEETFDGKVVFVDPQVSPVNQSARVWAKIENKSGRLIEGLPAAMTIKHGKKSKSGGTTARPKASGILTTSGNR